MLGPTKNYRRITFIFTAQAHQVKVHEIERVPPYEKEPLTEELRALLAVWFKASHDYENWRCDNWSYISSSPESFGLDPLPNGYRAVFTGRVDASPFYNLTAHDEIAMHQEVQEWAEDHHLKLTFPKN